MAEAGDNVHIGVEGEVRRKAGSSTSEKKKSPEAFTRPCKKVAEGPGSR